MHIFGNGRCPKYGVLPGPMTIGLRGYKVRLSNTRVILAQMGHHFVYVIFRANYNKRFIFERAGAHQIITSWH